MITARWGFVDAEFEVRSVSLAEVQGVRTISGLGIGSIIASKLFAPFSLSERRPMMRHPSSRCFNSSSD